MFRWHRSFAIPSRSLHGASILRGETLSECNGAAVTMLVLSLGVTSRQHGPTLHGSFNGTQIASRASSGSKPRGGAPGSYTTPDLILAACPNPAARAGGSFVVVAL